MARQSFSVNEKNDQWLREQVTSREYSSKSELVNDLIRQARGQQRKIDWIRTKLERSEQRGFSNRTPEEILAIAQSGK